MSVNPLPKGTQPLVPYIIVDNAAKAIEYYHKVFLAEEVTRMLGPDGKKIMHAELLLCGCMMYIADEQPDLGAKSPRSLSHSPVSFTLYCLDADKVFQRAIKAGGTVIRPMMDAFWGARHGTICDPFGHQWTLMTRKEDLTPEELEQRAKNAII